VEIMKFDDLDRKMRVFETAQDFCVLPGIWIVARIDGRSFTRLTKETHKFEAPFDERFRDYMVATVEHLMSCGFRVPYGYTESDEISLLFHHNENLFDRKLRKLISVLAGEASAAFSVRLGSVAYHNFRMRPSYLTIFAGARKMRIVTPLMHTVIGHCAKMGRPLKMRRNACCVYRSQTKTNCYLVTE
jgi:hypothetical protein